MRLFVGVWPPVEVVGLLSELARPDRRGLRWTGPAHWHVTLRFLGSVDRAEEPMAALAAMDAAGPVTASAGPAVTVLGRGILCLPVAGLDELAGAVVAATAGIGRPPEGRPFRGHLTLARAKPGVDLRPLGGVPLSAEWPVEEVTLVVSDTRPEGAHYQVLATYPVGRLSSNFRRP